MIIKKDQLTVEQFAGLVQFLASEDNLIRHPDGKMFHRQERTGGITKCKFATFAVAVRCSQKETTIRDTETEVTLSIQTDLRVEGEKEGFKVPLSYLDKLIKSMGVMG